jgi:hypothetical protein
MITYLERQYKSGAIAKIPLIGKFNGDRNSKFKRSRNNFFTFVAEEIRVKAIRTPIYLLKILLSLNGFS